MAKQATLQELQELHRLVAQSLNSRLQQDLDDNLPTDAATMGAAIKFLKDNAVTADPADADDLDDLRRNLTAQASRRQQVGNVLQLVKEDLEQE